MASRYRSSVARRKERSGMTVSRPSFGWWIRSELELAEHIALREQHLPARDGLAVQVERRSQERALRDDCIAAQLRVVDHLAELVDGRQLRDGEVRTLMVRRARGALHADADHGAAASQRTDALL